MKKYVKVSLDTDKVVEGLQAFLNTLDENEIAVDEITFDVTSEKTGKSTKIELFKEFDKFCKEYKNENP